MSTIFLACFLASAFAVVVVGVVKTSISEFSFRRQMRGMPQLAPMPELAEMRRMMDASHRLSCAALKQDGSDDARAELEAAAAEFNAATPASNREGILNMPTRAQRCERHSS